MASISIGISGWRYAPWRGVFYPANLPHRCELEFAASVLPTIEINGSFYSLQRPESYLRWYEETPRGFVFAVKAHRYITHMRKLRDVEKPLANFFSSGVLNLRDKLGPILWQLPPQVRYDAATMERFLALLPHDTAAALALARKREPRMFGRSRLAIDRNRRLRHALEVRHESFGDPAFIVSLRRHGVALVIADTARRWPYWEDVTAGFLYLRLHGDKELYASGYSSAALDRWAQRVRAWSRGREPPDAMRIAGPARRALGRDIYCYFDNDVKVRAPFDAQSLRRKLGCDDRHAMKSSALAAARRAAAHAARLHQDLPPLREDRRWR